MLENPDTLETETLPRKQIPQDAKEGDALVFEDGVFVIDTVETHARETRIKNMFDRLKKKN